MTREEFERWVLWREHGKYGELYRAALARTDDGENYLNDYVQGCWTMAQMLPEAYVQPIAHIVTFGGDCKEVAWSNGTMPPPGTRLYACVNAGEVARLNLEIEKLYDESMELELRALRFIHRSNAAIDLSREFRVERDQLKVENEALRAQLAQLLLAQAENINNGQGGDGLEEDRLHALPAHTHQEGSE